MRFCPHPEEIDADVLPVPLLERHPEYVVGKAVAKCLPFETCEQLRDYDGKFTAFKGIGPAKAEKLDEVRRELRG